MMGRKKLMKTALLALFFFAFNLLAVDNRSLQKDEDSLHKARQLIQDGDLAGAVDELQRIVQLLENNPDMKNRLAEAHYLMAKVYFTAGDRQLVEDHLRKVYSTDPTFSTSEPDLYFREIVENIKKEFPEIAQPKGPDTQETNSSSNIIAKERKKKRKPPVLLILGGIAILTALILILSKKKKSTTESGGIRISSNPSEAKIFLDGRDTGHQTPFTLSYVKVGEHTIKLEKTGFEAFETTVTVEPNKEVLINANLETFWSGVEWIEIPAGTFKMGDSYAIGFPDELPVHDVYLNTYYISRHEITFQQYDRFCDETGRTKPSDHNWGRDTRPVIFVTFSDAQTYCQWLSEKTGMNILLPTEAQWEKAAQGTIPRIYPWGNGIPDCNRANFRGCTGKTMPVGTTPAGQSPYGIHDMAGNVWEWCRDWYSEDFYATPEAVNDDPTGPNHGTTRVMRGGSFGMMEPALRCSNRNAASPNYSGYALGFRVVSTTPPAGQESR
jgi:formylglycine-generating enzyme required for sulfatase activity